MVTIISKLTCLIGFVLGHAFIVRQSRGGQLDLKSQHMLLINHIKTDQDQKKTKKVTSPEDNESF